VILTHLIEDGKTTLYTKLVLKLSINCALETQPDFEGQESLTEYKILVSGQEKNIWSKLELVEHTCNPSYRVKEGG
jgi:hypothetical protein